MKNSRRQWPTLLVAALVALSSAVLLSRFASNSRGPDTQRAVGESANRFAKPRNAQDPAVQPSPDQPGEKVLRVQSNGVPGCQVEVSAVPAPGVEAPAVVARGVGDDRGRCEIPLPDSLRLPLVLRITKPGYGTQTVSVDSLEVTIALKAERSIRGVVLNQDDAPLAGATVRVHGSPETRTDSAGEFGVIIGEGPFSLQVECDGYMRYSGVADGDTSPLRVVLQRAHFVRGTVRLQNGVGVSGISVKDRVTGMTAESGERGEFVLSFPAGITPELSCGGHADVRLERISGDETDIVILGSALLVLVTDESGRPIPNARMEYQVHASGRQVGGGFRDTSAVGRTTLLVPAGATVQITARSSGGGSTSETVQLPPGTQELEHRITVTKQAGRGVVVLRPLTDEGKVLKVIRIAVMDDAGNYIGSFKNVKMDVPQDGRIELAGVRAGSVSLRLADESAAHWQDNFSVPLLQAIQVPEGGAVQRECVFQTGGRLNVSLRDSMGALLAPAAIEVSNSDGPMGNLRFAYEVSTGVWEDATDKPTTAWLVDALPAGAYVVKCWESPGAGQKAVPAGSCRVVVVRGRLTSATVVRGTFEE